MLRRSCVLAPGADEDGPARQFRGGFVPPARMRRIPRASGFVLLPLPAMIGDGDPEGDLAALVVPRSASAAIP